MTRVDVLVLGGGPAGAAIGALAAKAGARTLILEKETFPRDKVCGEFLSAEGCAVVARLGLAPGLIDRGAVPIEACLLVDGQGRTAASPLPPLPGVGRTALGITRATLDTALLENAAACGAVIRDRTAGIKPILENGRVAAVSTRSMDSGSRNETIRATIVVAADGRRSMLQRALHPDAGDPLTTTKSSWFGFATHFPDPDPHDVDRRIELFVFDGGYAGLGAVEGGRLNLALIARIDALAACGNTPQRLFEARMLGNPLLRARLRGVERCSTWKSVGPLRFNVRIPASHGAIFLGDAAGTIDPFCGEGMSNALHGAELAMPFVVEALAAGRLSDPAARDWSRAWRHAFAPVTRRVRIVGKIFEHPRPASLAMTLLRLPHGARMLPGLVAATRTGAV